MKLSLRLIASLVFSISLLTFLVARNQVRSEKSGMRGDLARRAEVLTESLQETVEPVLQKGPTQLRRIVERFGDRQHLAGVAIYDTEGKLLAASAKLGNNAGTPPNVFATCNAIDEVVGDFIKLTDIGMFAYEVPAHRDASLAGVFFTFHDAGFIEAQSSNI